MSVQRNELVEYTDKLLDITSFTDYCPNGLQVEGAAEIDTMVSGVTASLALIEAAVARGAQLLLVHHGWFWKGGDGRVVGMHRRRMARLLEQDINLLAYHLPLDAHHQYGNNVQLADRLGLSVDGEFAGSGVTAIGRHGRLGAPLPAVDLARRIETALGRAPLHIQGNDRPIETVAWCSGGAQGYIEQAADLGVDAYISGEISEQTVHIARERGIHYFAAGHHATERYGAQALGEHLAQTFGLAHEFIDIDNPA